jgi:Uma2 family endonuclease
MIASPLHLERAGRSVRIAGSPASNAASASRVTDSPAAREKAMNLKIPPAPAGGGAIKYPEDDGLPMADNTRQLRWIVVLYGNLCALFRQAADVFVAANLLWYPEEGHPEICNAPDVMVNCGRPKGDRSSYRQWEEAGVPVTVAFEILSPDSTATALANKFAFYEDYGVQEYYIYDPEENRLHVFVRRGGVLVRVRQVDGYVSPRLGIRFDLSGPEMLVYGSDGSRFLTFEEIQAERERERQERLAAEQRAGQAEQRAGQAEQRVQEAEQRADQLRRRGERQAELMRRVLRQQATPEEQQELERLLEQPPPPPG